MEISSVHVARPTGRSSHVIGVSECPGCQKHTGAFLWVFTLGDVDCKTIDCDCKSEVNINYKVSKNQSNCFLTSTAKLQLLQ